MKGKGILTGMGVTLGHFLKHFKGGAVTEFYPEEMPKLQPRYQGSFELIVPKCIACSLCVNACPNKVIKMETIKDENNKRKLSSYKMYLERCLYCGLCVEACPTSAVIWTHNFETAVYQREDMNWDMMARYFDKNPQVEEVEVAKVKEETPNPEK